MDEPQVTVTESTPPKPAPKTQTAFLSEAALFESPDSATYTVPVTLIAAGWSKNGRYYGKETLSRAAAAFDGTKAYADHPGTMDEKNRPERSVKDIVGYYSDVRQSDSGSLVGKLHILGAARDWLWPLVTETATNKPDLIGLSINAVGKTSQGEMEGRRGVIVEDIMKGNSTDIVTTPAAGGRFEKLLASHDDLTADLLSVVGYEEWREARPEHLDRLKREYASIWKDDTVKTAEAQSKTLRETIAEKDKRIAELTEVVAGKDTQLDSLSAENTRREMQSYADKLLTEARWMPSAWQPNVRATLLSESNTGNWPAMVSAEQVKFAAVRPPITVRGAGTVGIPARESIAPWALERETPEQFRIRTQPLRS